MTKGLTLYKDFSVVTTPLYYFIGSVFIKIFGNYIISTQIFDAILISSIFLLMFKQIKWKAGFVLLPIIFKFPNSYTLFSLFWIMLIIYIINKEKYNDVSVGIIIGLAL